MVQIGRKWPFARAVQVNLDGPNMSRNLVSQHRPQNYLSNFFGTPCTWQPVLMNANHKTNRDFDIPDDEPASTNSKLPKTADAVDNLERSNWPGQWTLDTGQWTLNTLHHPKQKSLGL